MRETFDKTRAGHSVHPISPKDDLSTHPPRLAEAPDLPKTSEGLLVPGVGRLPHLKVLSEAFMGVVSQEEVIVSAASPLATALEASVAAIHSVGFLAGVTPEASPAVVTAEEVTDNRQVIKKRTTRSSFFTRSLLSHFSCKRDSFPISL